MGRPEEFKCIWKGCNHTEEQRGAAFDGDYDRFCNKCNKLLTGVWICLTCKKEPVKFEFTVDRAKCYLFTCPECGAFYEYNNEIGETNESKTDKSSYATSKQFL